MKRLISDKVDFEGNIEKLDEVLNYIKFFTDIKEEDYISYTDRCFEYTPEFYKFIELLFEAGMVEDYEAMLKFLEEVKFDIESSSNYNTWVREMNKIICRPDLLRKVNISFLQKAFLTLIRIEKIIPGSWGIDVEVGTWLKLLKQLEAIRKEI